MVLIRDHERTVAYDFWGDEEDIVIINIDILSHMKEWMQNNEDIPDGWIYLGDDKERYILGQPGRYNMLVFGVNPSTASPGENNLDPTIRKVRNVIRESSYDG